MKVAGICLVRNEGDILPISLAHHLTLGLDEVLVVDNGSTDGTARALARWRGDRRVTVRRDGGTFHQARWTNELVHEVRRRGADWVLVFDADEFWYAPGGDFRGVLAASRAGALHVQVINFVQRRAQRTNRPDALLHMRHRAVPQEVPNPDQAVAAGSISFLEAPFPPKWVSRPTEAYEGSKGTHLVEGVDGPKQATDEIVCLHAPIRSFRQLQKKADNGRRQYEAGVVPGESWQSLRWMRLAESGGLEAEWAANSSRRGEMKVGGRRRALVRDGRLVSLVRPHLSWPWRWLPA